MLKILEKNLAIARVIGSLKRSAASVTGLSNRYRFDPFFRTELNTITLQTIFALAVLTLIYTYFNYLYHDVGEVLISAISKISFDQANPETISGLVVKELGDIRIKNLVTITVLTVFMTVLFGYVIARIALSPTRDALASQKIFIGNIAHELRTPISIIKTNTEVALMEPGVTDDLRHTLGSNVEELDRISDIINNLLSLSGSIRPERIEFAVVDLNIIVSEVIKKLSRLTRQRELEISVMKGGTAMVIGNAAALEQITMNVIKNAANYTSRGGRVSVTTESIGDTHVEFIVGDSGKGIGRKDLFHVFEPFYRAEPSRIRSTGGSGLGLTIVSELVKLHRGKITVRSALGRGTTVTVSLPAAPVSKTPPQNLRKETPPSLDEITFDFSNRHFETHKNGLHRVFRA